MLQTFVRFMKDDRGAAVPAALLPLAAASGLAVLAAHGHGLVHHHLALSMPDGLGGNLDPGAAAGIGAAAVPVVGVGAIKETLTLKTDHNFARDVSLFNKVKEKDDMIEAPVTMPDGRKVIMAGYKIDENRAICVPVEFAEYLSTRVAPLTRLVFTTLTTLWLNKPETFTDSKTGITYGVVKTTLYELMKILKLSICGKNADRIKRSLETLHKIHYKGLVFFYRGEDEKGKPKKKPTGKLEIWTVLVPTLAIATKTEVKSEEATVVVHLCPPLVSALSEPGRGIAIIPLSAVLATRKTGKMEMYAQNILFYLAGSSPGEKNQNIIKRKKETLLEACCFDSAKRPDKNRKRLHKILDVLKNAGFLKEWKVEKDVYIMKLQPTSKYQC